MAPNKAKIVNFLQEQIIQADFRSKAYVFDHEEQKRPERSIFYKMQSHLDLFFTGNTQNRWITLTGLRGAGKTTLLSQLFVHYKDKDVYKLFLSLDQTSQILNISLNEIIEIYEDIIGKSIENLDKPLILFLDEVQYDPKWAITLKTIFDRSHKVFIFATGSAALIMNTNADITRRSIFEKLFPLNFREYMKIKHHKDENESIGQEICNIIFSSQNAKDVFHRLQTIEQKMNEYYLGISRFEFEAYLNCGSLPFMVASQNESIVYDQIHKTLDRVIHGDIASTGRFGSEIVSKIPALLYAVSDMDAFNFSTLSEAFDISRPKVMEIFDLLEKTEILYRIAAHGSHLNQSRKPAKYLFSAPAFRAMYYKMIGNIISVENSRGKLLEDTISMYLHRIFYQNPSYSLTYDSSQGGADFILGIGKNKIILEVGAGIKNFRQIIATAKKISSSYNIIISEAPLEYSEELNTIKIPIKIFALL